MTEQPTELELVAGKVIAGRFRLERLLGKGGMGSVWAAHHLSLNVEVALKFIDASVAKRNDVASRFAQEAQAAAKVKGSHVVNIFDYGTDEADRPYIAMELLQGEELSKRLERCDQLPIADVCRIVTHACRGLGRAHAAGIVHRDLKPENLFLVDEDDAFVVKVLDFGIAKAHSPVGAVTPHTTTGQILGTPLYMSPEQALGTGDIDFRSDLYSLAVVAYRCLTGSVPFHSKALGELIVKVTTQPVPSARAKRPELPPAVDEWFQRAMHKEPQQRFGSAREMAEQFARACAVGAHSGTHAALPGPPPSRASEAQGPSSDPESWWMHDEPTPPPDLHEAVTIAAEAPEGATPEGVTPGPVSARARRVAGATDSSSVKRPAETLMGTTATYVPPSSRPWFSILAAAGLMLLLVGAIVMLATRPFGPSGPFAALLNRERVSPDGVSAAAPRPPPSAPLASAKPNASSSTAREASSAAPSKPNGPSTEAPARRRPAPHPRPPKAPTPAFTAAPPFTAAPAFTAAPDPAPTPPTEATAAPEPDE
ncbi:MAG TPA: serine/threonine-protein kinase [Polyangiaceae bacterium]|nr:serine/threonine-protein kinase [Polyangiaceae bacterium]